MRLPLSGFLSVVAATMLATACVASNVVAPAERMVVPVWQAAAWVPISAEDLPGLYSSVEITGPLAGSVWKVQYLFEESGRFTGAALLGGAQPEFQVLSGTWRMADGLLVIDDAEPAEVLAAPGLLRLSGPDGTVVLERDPSF